LSDVTIALFDVTGKLVKILVDENQDAGNYSIPLSINGKLEAGVYLVEFQLRKKTTNFKSLYYQLTLFSLSNFSFQIKNIAGDYPAVFFFYCFMPFS